MPSSQDPLMLSDLSVDAVAAQKLAKEAAAKKGPSELELQKEARLAEKENRLAGSKSKTKPDAPVPAPLPATPQIDRSALLDKISAYRERFPFLKKRNTISGKSSSDEILDELHYIELQLGSQQGGSNNIGGMLMYGCMAGIETFTHEYWNPLGLNLTGLGTVTQQNMKDFQPLVDELMIKYGAGTYTSPEWRMVLMIGATVVTVNAANNNPEMARAVKSMNSTVNRPAGSDTL